VNYRLGGGGKGSMWVDYKTDNRQKPWFGDL